MNRVEVQEYIRERIARHGPRLIELQRELHRHPELSFEEAQTSLRLKTFLTEHSLPWEGDYAVYGLRCRIQGQPGPRTALRADMDALPITEDTGLAFASNTPGVMHACGHDAHMTMAMGAALVLKDLGANLPGEALVFFQPAEEKAPGGAKAMLEQGLFSGCTPGAIWGQHINPGLPAGVFGFRPGRMMAAVDDLLITIRGHGGHAAAPHLTTDPVHAAAHLITGLQGLVSRFSNPDTPTVLSFGRLEADGSFNVIPDKVKLSGTFRTVDARWRTEAMDRIRSMTTSLVEAFDCTAEITVIPGYPPVDNDPHLADFAKNCAIEFVGDKRVVDLPLVMWAEDFAYYREAAPACFYNLGISVDPTLAVPLHNARLHVDEDAILEGAAFMAWLAWCDLVRQAGA